MPNPYKGASQLIETIRAVKPPEGAKYTPMVQIAHNAFTFNNHVYLMNLLKPLRSGGCAVFPAHQLRHVRHQRTVRQ